MKIQSAEELKKKLDKHIDTLFISFSAIMLFFGIKPFADFYFDFITGDIPLTTYYIIKFIRDIILFFSILISFILRFGFKKKKAQQLLFCLCFYLYMFSMVFTVKISYSIPFFAITATIILIQLIDITNLFKTTFLIFTLALYITIGVLQLTGLKQTQYGIMDFNYFTLILNSIFFSVFLIATYLLNKKTRINTEQKLSEIVEQKLETIDRLNRKLDNQHKEVDFMQTAKTGFGNTLYAIGQENAKLYNYLVKNKQRLKYEDIYLYSFKIKDRLNKFIETLVPEQARKESINYDLVLDKPTYNLHITNSDNTYTISLSETYLSIIEELMKNLIGELESHPEDDRGFTDKNEFEKKLFQGITDANRLNSNVTRIRKELRNLGLDPKLIETKHQRIRLNTISKKITILDF